MSSCDIMKYYVAFPTGGNTTSVLTVTILPLILCAINKKNPYRREPVSNLETFSSVSLWTVRISMGNSCVLYYSFVNAQHIVT